MTALGAAATSAPLAASSSASYPPDTVMANTPAISGMARPAYLVKTADSTYGRFVTRISDQTAFGGTSDAILKHTYGLFPPWNADESLLLLDYGMNAHGYLLNGQTYAYLRRITISNSRHTARWSPVNPDNLFGCQCPDFVNTPAQTNNKLVVSHPQSNTSTQPTETVLHTFTQYDYITFAADKSSISWDGLVGAITGSSAAQGKWGITTFSIGSPMSATPTITEMSTYWSGVANTASPDDLKVRIMPDGSGVIVFEIGVNANTTWRSSANLATNVVIDTIGARHVDIGKDESGNMVMGSIGGGNFEINARIISPSGTIGANTALLDYTSTLGYSFHISAQARNRPGWFYFSDLEQDASKPYEYQKVGAVKMDGSQTVEIFGVNHCSFNTNLSDNTTSALVVPSRDGSRCLIGSDWGAGTPNYAYILTAT